MNLFLGGLLLIIAVAGVWIFWRPLRPKDPTHVPSEGYRYPETDFKDHHSSSHDGHHDS